MQASTIGFNPDYSEEAPAFEDIQALSGYSILEFGTPWCEYCQASQAAVEGALKENLALLHIKVFDGKGKRLGRQFGVKLWPTLILLKDGEEVDRIVRFTSLDEVVALLGRQL
ncbi:thioredoxin family protein [Marinomonas algarum]|uniref:Thioredoxin family protein n=1 Tax=Marinomonas algarum TaxID=2883105 RepID=A0A9X1IL08_9GAMM|nr:thioredoxin family protein [Marinomonas algarum]MCB5161439.1 thioredoxin family protein [Marinomonas algarum]